jgi:heptosyltransferase-2
MLFFGPGEREIVDTIMNLTSARIVDTRDEAVDLELLKPAIERCDLLVTNDTGPRHYAVAFGRPVVVVMGPTDPRYTAANLDRTIVVRRELECSPCHKKVCPREHECMRQIQVMEVFAAVERLLSARG